MPSKGQTKPGESVIFAQRLMHFANLWTAYRDLLSGRYSPSIPWSEHDPYPNIQHTLMFVLYGWFYSLVEDADGAVNAFRVWRERYPKEESAIAAVEAEVVPLKNDLRVFRNRLGFHGSTSWSHESAGFDLFANHSGTQILEVMKKFKTLGAALFATEKTGQTVQQILDAREPKPDSTT
jgi:hypothetical protein